MKQLLYLAIVLLCFNCSVDDSDNVSTTLMLLPVESVEFPDTVTLNASHTIRLTYLRPSPCHAFRDIFHRTEGNARVVAILSEVFISNQNCNEILNSELETSFEFRPTSPGTYVFKFLKSQNASTNTPDGDYLVHEIIVN